MAVVATEYANNRRPRTWLPFVLGLIIGLLLGGLTAYAAYKENKPAASDDAAKASSQSSENDSEPQAALNSEQQADVARYAVVLMEASREGVDVPSGEAEAAKGALSNAAEGFVSVLKDAKLLKSSANEDDLTSTVTAMNESFLAYASTARQGDEHGDVDDAVDRFGNYLKQNAKPENESQLDAALVSFKNTVLESIRDFVSDDYKAAYDKEAQAQTELQKIVDGLRKQ